MNIGFIGAGKAGCTLGKYFSEDYQTKIVGYYSRSKASAEEAARFTESKSFDSIEELIEECEAIFLTVPDGNIRDTWNRVREYDIEGKLICHCSGSMSCEDAFPGLEETKALGYSVHPLFAISDKFNAYKELTDVFFTIEEAEKTTATEETVMRGMEQAVRLMELIGLVMRLGNPYRVIRGEDKTTYHCAAAMASNLVCALTDQSVELMTRCGFTQEEAIKALAPILRGNIEHIIEKGTVASFTGPVERNDTQTIKKHLGCLKDGDEKNTYRLLTGRLIHMAEQRHPDRDYAGMSELIRKGEEK